ncbi:MAG: dihydropteroate synthase, partial [Bacteroidia bacterium]
MGILNITPDSFFAGSRVSDLESVVQRAANMIDS